MVLVGEEEGLDTGAICSAMRMGIAVCFGTVLDLPEAKSRTCRNHPHEDIVPKGQGYRIPDHSSTPTLIRLGQHPKRMCRMD